VNRRRVAIAAVAAFAVLAAGAAVGWWRFGRAIDVPVAVVVEGAIPARVVGPGTLQARVPVTVAARVGSTVAEVRVDVGDAVRAGQPLVVLDDRDLAARLGVVGGQQEAMRRNVEGARAALAKARADLELARAKRARDAQLLERGFVSQAVLDASVAAADGAAAAVESARATLAAREADVRTLSQEARYAETVLSHTRIASPIDGMVVQRLVEAGTSTVPGTPLLKLVDPSTLWVATRVDESVVGRVEPGQPATIRLRSGSTHAGRVARIARQSDAATRELDVHVAFDEIPARFAIDQEAEVTIRVGEDRGLLVPAGALVRDRQGRQGVLVLDGGRARFRPVRTGGEADGRVRVVEGLDAGATVVAAADGVRAGARVRPAAVAPR
jgi:RND family efflux transporter MFP subunit